MTLQDLPGVSRLGCRVQALIACRSVNAQYAEVRVEGHYATHHGQQWVRNISRGDGHFVHGGQPSEGIRNVPACVLDAIIQIGPGGNRLHEGKPGLHESRTHTCCPMDHSSDERRNAGSNKCCATCHWWRWQVGIGLCWSRSCARSDGGSSGSDVGYHAILQGKTQWRGGARIFFRRW